MVVDGVSGFLCRVRDARSLHQAMARLAALDPPALRAMGLAARDKVQREFSEDLVIEAYIRALRELRVAS